VTSATPVDARSAWIQGPLFAVEHVLYRWPVAVGQHAYRHPWLYGGVIAVGGGITLSIIGGKKIEVSPQSEVIHTHFADPSEGVTGGWGASGKVVQLV